MMQVMTSVTCNHALYDEYTEAVNIIVSMIFGLLAIPRCRS